MTPKLKNLNRRVKREYYKHRKSAKWRRLKKQFKKLKKKTVRTFYSEFVSELKLTNPSKWYTMARQLGAVQTYKNNELSVECLKGMDNSQAAEEIATHFSKISQEYEYSPLATDKLPAYLPAQEILSVDEIKVVQVKM